MCVGLLVVIFVNFWILYSLYLIQASWLQVTHFPMGLFVPFMLLALLINPILKAARGTDGRTYPWGEQEPTGAYAVMDEGGYCGRSSWLNPPSGPVQSICQTLPVGSRPRGASPYGVQDMAGNVWEWCGDWYNETYYSKSLKKNPPGPTTGDFRVVRGGSWHHLPRYLQTSARFRFYPDYRNIYIGFRCVQEMSR